MVAGPILVQDLICAPLVCGTVLRPADTMLVLCLGLLLYWPVTLTPRLPASSDVLRLDGCVMTRTGREHQRRSQTCEDVPHVEVPLRGTQGVGLFCIFDGHCGRNTAKVGPGLQRNLCWRPGGSASSGLLQAALSVAETHLTQPRHPSCAHCSRVRFLSWMVQESGLGKASCQVPCAISPGQCVHVLAGSLLPVGDDWVTSK